MVISFLCRRRLGAMAGAASALYILDMKGRVLIWRDYRGDVPASAAEKFFAKLMESEVSSCCMHITVAPCGCGSARAGILWVPPGHWRVIAPGLRCRLLPESGRPSWGPLGNSTANNPLYGDHAQDDPSSRDPVMLENGVTFCFIQHNNVYLMIASKHNCNAASMLLFLHKAVEVSHMTLPLCMQYQLADLLLALWTLSQGLFLCKLSCSSADRRECLCSSVPGVQVLLRRAGRGVIERQLCYCGKLSWPTTEWKGHLSYKA